LVELLKSEYKFSIPSVEALKEFFWKMHLKAEERYNGDGSWGKRTQWSTGGYGPEPDGYKPSNLGLLRHTSWNLLSYISAYKVDNKEIYLKRAREGLEYLLRNQCDASTPNLLGKNWPRFREYRWYSLNRRWPFTRSVEGAFPWRAFSDKVVTSPFETGVDGRAVAEGYKFFKDKRYLESSIKAAEWELHEPIHSNVNYNSLTIWHLVAHYEITGDEDILESAICRMEQGVISKQLENGAWLGHNAWIWYHGFNARAMVELYRVLPKENPFREKLYGPTVAAINHIIASQRENGSLINCWDLTELWRQKGRRSRTGEPEPSMTHSAMQAMITAERDLGLNVRNELFGMIKYVLGGGAVEGETIAGFGEALEWLDQLSS